MLPKTWDTTTKLTAIVATIAALIALVIFANGITGQTEPIVTDLADPDIPTWFHSLCSQDEDCVKVETPSGDVFKIFSGGTIMKEEWIPLATAGELVEALMQIEIPPLFAPSDDFILEVE